MLYHLLCLALLFSCTTKKSIIESVVEKNKFTRHRSLEDYQNHFGEDFSSDLKNLTSESHWIDGGSGEAYAQKDYLGSRDGKIIDSNKAKLTAITFKYEDQPVPYLKNDHLKIFSGRYFENIPLSELEVADLITDLYGIINYSIHLDVVLRMYLKLLKPGGKIYVVIPKMITTIVVNGKNLSLIEWLKTIPGITINPITKQKPYPIKYFGFIISDVDQNAKIPDLKLISERHEKFVYRTFSE